MGKERGEARRGGQNDLSYRLSLFGFLIPSSREERNQSWREVVVNGIVIRGGRAHLCVASVGEE